ncbi:hypothetical protein AMS68_005564 [Peltaster fructicola]|uniref:FAS1 domain-containing protein n=1 Tax=Peltaster fructicola TaxID=286661 RepID=A0A6H0XZ70_9PEZI|nr:hypothetical protein AMS68_005564 [Peltaster fructicola]
MQLRRLLVLTTPALVAAQFSDIVNGINSIANVITSEFGNGFAQVTSIGGSLYTVVTAAVPSGASSIGQQVTSIGGSVYTILTSEAGVLTSNLASIGTQVTSIEGSLYTVITSAANPSALSSYGAQATSLGGQIYTIITSNVGTALVGRKTTTVNGSVYTVATNVAGQVVSTVAPAATSTSSSSQGAAMITQAPMLAGGVLGLAAVALL